MSCGKCDLHDLDYSDVDRGRITCRRCGWGWVLNLDPDSGRLGWHRKELV